MDILVRQAKESDFPKVSELLYDISKLHHEKRPDIFKGNGAKYDETDFVRILKDHTKPVFVAENTQTDTVVGYVFCQSVINRENNVLHEYRSLYIDDFCVDNACRNCGIGRKLFDFVKEYAVSNDYHYIDLNVWELNESGIRFYESCGMKVQRRRMEFILK